MDNNSSPLFLTPDISITPGQNGISYIQSRTPLSAAPTSVITYLHKWAEERPDTVFLAERNPAKNNTWSTLTYREFLNQATRLAANLQVFDLSENKPLMLLSGNSLSNALMLFAGYLLGVPVVPVSPSYSLLSKKYEKVHHIQALTNANTVFAESADIFAGALKAMEEKGLRVITADKQARSTSHTLLQQLIEQEPPVNFTPANLTANGVAKYMFTSGSTGMPKGVINTHGMLSSNQQAIAQIWPFIEKPGHVFLDWLPWHHTFGGNHNLNMVLRNGASLYIDNGKPTPDGILVTLENIKDIAPTLSFNVAAGYDLLAAALDKDPLAARCFFKNLDLIFFAAAALPQSIWSRLENLIEKYAERPIPITSSWGQTETSPLCTSVYFDSKVPNNIGVPIPGTQLKLAPVGDMTELRVKGPNIMPAYLNDPEKTREVFDDEGYLCSGDAVELNDAEHPELGLIFKGRVSENFKLQSATWVNVGELRLALISALSPLASDIVICGQDQKYIGILIFPNIVACQEFIGGKMDVEDLIIDPNLTAEIRMRLTLYNRNNSTSSKRVQCALLQAKPPSFDDNEITDKGYLNQRGILKNRDTEVKKLYTNNYQSPVIAI